MENRADEFTLEAPQEPEGSEKRRWPVLVIYDIALTKRRNKLVKLLKGYAGRVQKSAFECVLDRKLYDKLLAEIDRFYQPGDLIRVYRLTGSADVTVWGGAGQPQYEDVIII